MKAQQELRNAICRVAALAAALTQATMALGNTRETETAQCLAALVEEHAEDALERIDTLLAESSRAA